MQDNNENNESSIIKARYDNLAEIQDLGYEDYPTSFEKSHKAAEISENYGHLESGEKTEDEAALAGRIMAIRNSGMFIDLMDDSGRIQIFSHKNNITDPNQLELLKKLDIGDIIGVKGIIRRTPRGEITVNSYEIKFLAKAFNPLPDKFHGLSDVEVRYRQRYVDFIVNDSSRSVMQQRAEIIQNMRAELTRLKFLEVETPMLHPIPGGAIAKPFITHHNSLGTDLYLRIAPELYLKKLVIGGVSEKVFELNRCFRNEGISPKHNPEFTTIECYQAYVDYNAMIDLTEDLISNVLDSIYGGKTLLFGENEINYTTPWKRRSMLELVDEETGKDFSSTNTLKEAAHLAEEIGIKIKEEENWGKVIETVFEERVEEKLIQPIHVTGFPKDISPLAKRTAYDPRLTERFESYVNGWEIANGFSELNDPEEQLARFREQAASRESGDDEAHHIDYDFINALRHGMPPMAGLGLGLDRLIMLFTNSHSIREVIAFPTLKPKSN